MPNTPDPRDTVDALSTAVVAAMVIVDRIATLSGGAEVEVTFVPAQGEPFTVVGEDQDKAYVATRMAARKASVVGAAIAKTNELKAQLEALL